MEMKKVEETLAKSQAEFKVLFNAIPDAAVYTDIKRSILMVNPAFTTIFGYQFEEVKGLTTEFLYKSGQDYEDTGRSHYRVGIDPERQPLEMRFRCKDGTIFWAESRGEQVKDVHGNIVGFFEIHRDITQRKKAAEKLAESEERYRSLVENINLGVTLIDSDYNIVMTNAAQGSFSQKAVGELVGKKCFREFEKRQVVCPHCPGTQAMKTGKPAEVETVTVRDDGTRLNIRLKAYPILEQDNVASGFIQIVEDITEKTKLEGQLQRAQKMEAIGTLVGGIAHDFNNILFPIMGYAEMALDDVPEGSPLRLKIQNILQGTKRASDLVKHILAFSRQSEQKPKPLKVQLVVKEVMKLMRSSLPTTIEIKQDIDNRCGLVMIDGTRVHQVVMNLITNAFHAMEDESGVLSVTLKEIELTPDSLISPSMAFGRYLCLTVADTGKGMDPSTMCRIFEPYYTTKAKGKGTGLGLTVAYGIIKSYGGDIKVYSEPGRGSEFHVYLPVIESEPEAEKTEAVESVPQGTERILIVDDEEKIVHMEKQMLERMGYHVTARANSMDALEAFRAGPGKFDLVITDMTMPNMTGFQLAQELLEIKPDIPIIICTGFSTKISEAKLKELGIRDFVIKPVVKRELAKKIREVLDKRI